MTLPSPRLPSPFLVPDTRGPFTYSVVVPVCNEVATVATVLDGILAAGEATHVVVVVGTDPLCKYGPRNQIPSYGMPSLILKGWKTPSEIQ